MKRILPLLLLPALAQASLYGTGGTETAVAGTSDVTHTFTSDGTFTLSEAQSVRILLIGGGGAGGTDCGGGGGGGGFLEIAEVELAAGSYSVTVGPGGTPGSTANGRGGDSVFAVSGGAELYRAYGGGSGSGWSYEAGTGASSGGNANGRRPGPDPIATDPVQGYKGGYSSSNGPRGGGGAGGPAENGSNGRGGVGGNGGPGRASDITGTETYYGGGGAAGSYSGTPGTGGIGGGGNGIPECSATTAAERMADYKGADGLGGGGGGGNNTFFTAAAGGSGVVIIRLSNMVVGGAEPVVALGNPTFANFSATFSATLISAGSGSTDGLATFTLQWSADAAAFDAATFSGNETAPVAGVADDVSFTLADLPPLHAYYGRFKAVNDAEAVGYSQVFSFTTPALAEPSFTSADGWDSPGLLQYCHPAATKYFSFDETSAGLVLVPGTVMAGVGASGSAIHGSSFTDSHGTTWTFASHKSYGYVGYMWMDAGSDYHFFERMADSCRAAIDGVEFMNDDGYAWNTTTYATYACEETGWHKIQVWLGGSGGGAGCLDDWQYVFGYNRDGATACAAKPGAEWSPLENTAASTFLYPFRPGRTIDVLGYAPAAGGNALTFTLDLGETTGAPTDLWAVYGATYEGEATNDWDHLVKVGACPVAAQSGIAFDVPDTATYVRFFAVHDWGVSSWSPTVLVDLSAPSLSDLGVVHDGDEATFSLRVNGAGTGDLAVAVVVGTTPDLSDGATNAVAAATAAGVYDITLPVTPGGTYYYRLVADTTEGGHDETAVTSFTTLAGSSFTVAPSVDVVNRSVSYAGNCSFGAGATTFTIWGGDSADALTPRETSVYSLAGGAFVVFATFPEEPHSVYTKLVLSNVASGGTAWTNETGVSVKTTTDNVAYTWKAGLAEGDWNDTNCWTTAWNGSHTYDNVMTGYPSNSNASVSFPNATTGLVHVAGDYPVSRGYLNCTGSSFTIRGTDPATDRLRGDYYGGALSGTAFTFSRVNLVERDTLDNGIGADDGATGSVRFADGAVFASGSGFLVIRGTDSVFALESGAVYDSGTSDSPIRLMGSGENLVVSNATLSASSLFVGNPAGQTAPSLRIAGEAASLGVKRGVCRDYGTYENVDQPLLADFTVLFEIPPSGYTNGVPFVSTTASGGAFGGMVSDASTGRIVIACNARRMRSASARTFRGHVLAWRTGIDTDHVVLAPGDGYTLRYTYGWDAEANLPLGLAEPENEGDLPTGVWADVPAQAGTLILIK